MNSITALLVLRDSLRTNLTDPRITAGATNSRTWIHTDKPLTQATYPRIELQKIDNPTIPISMGMDYCEFEQLFVNVWFYTKKDFKITVNSVIYQDEQLVEYYLGLIKTTLKAQFSNLFTAGDKNYKHINTSVIAFDESTQLHFATVTVRVAYWGNR